MPAEQHKWLERCLDVALFVVTLGAVGISFIEGLPDWSNLAVLVLFVVLYFWRCVIAQDRTAYLKANWIDLALIVLLASPFLRLLVALKIAGIAPMLRIGTLIRANRERLLKLVVLSNDSLPVALTLMFAMVFVFGSSLWLLEHEVNPGLVHISDGLWWAFVTLTTVGYGDIVPQTTAGRMVGVLTMVLGIATYSLMIANLTFFVERTGRAEDAKNEGKPTKK
ncbi:MAG: potassium channel family protein [Mariprofundaceae bacterium]